MKTITRLDPQRRAGWQTLKSALQRLTMTLMLVMLTATAAWAETANPSFTDNGDDTYTIWTAAGWDMFCDALQDNTTYNGFSGKTVKLGADIAVSRVAGNVYAFCGTFDGQDHTLNFTITTENDGVHGVAPFLCVNETKPTGSNEVSHPAIRNLNVVADITTNHCNASGLVVRSCGTLTIEGCTVSGTIRTGNYGAGGFIGSLESGACAYVTNCVSSITIIDSKSSMTTSSNGGFVGTAGTGRTLHIKGCLFNGKLLITTNNNARVCGGFVGNSEGTVTITNSLYAPADPADGETWASTHLSATFVSGENGSDASITNSYYTRDFNDGMHFIGQGKLRRSITPGTNVTVAHAGMPTNYSVSGITAYKAYTGSSSFTDGIKYGGVLYAGSGDQVSLTLGNTVTTAIDLPAGYQYGGNYIASPGTLSGSTLTMPNTNVIVSVIVDTQTLVPIDWTTVNDGSEADPYIIYNNDQLDLLAQRVNWNETYENKYFVLGDDIKYSHTTDWDDATSTENNYTAIGCHYSGDIYHLFKGHFDGQGHTVSGIRIYKSGNYNNMDTWYQGLFGVGSEEAVIRGITLADTRITANWYVGGIVGSSNSIVSDCHVSASVALHSSNDYSSCFGGIVGANGNDLKGNGSISNCTSAVTITKDGIALDSYGGIAGTNSSGTLSHNLAIKAVVPATYEKSHGAICGGNGLGTLDGNFNYACNVASNGFNDYAVGGIILYDHSSRTDLNSYILTTVGNAAVSRVALVGRTLYKDGAWNTLCLPSDVTIANSPLDGDGVKAMVLRTSDSGLSGSTLTLNFSDAPATIAAGTPFIIKWDGDGTNNLEDPVFTGVTIDNSDDAIARKTQTSSDQTVQFLGSYGPVTLTGGDKSVFYLGSNNKLYSPSTNRTINACRAYFHVDLNGGEVQAIKLNFDDETTTAINEHDCNATLSGRESHESHELSGAWYSLDGRKLQGKPTAKGLYIYKGKKVVIK